MAGKIVADTLEHSTAGSIATSYVVDGGAKAYFSYSMSGTASIKKSLNGSSLTDNGTGDATLTVTSAMSDADYASAIEVGHAAITNNTLWTITGQDSTTARSTTIYRGNTQYVSSAISRTQLDTAYNSVTHFGDLA